MFRFVRKRRVAPLVEFTPLIDCAFILIIFFAVSTTLITTRAGMELNLPEASTVESVPKPVQIGISEDQSINFEDMKIDIDSLGMMVESKLRDDPDVAFVVGAERSVPYQQLIRVLDIVRKSGGTRLALQAEKKYEEETEESQ